MSIDFCSRWLVFVIWQIILLLLSKHILLVDLFKWLQALNKCELSYENLVEIILGHGFCLSRDKLVKMGL